MYKKIIYLILLVFILIDNVSALKLPSEYEDGQCELIAKDFQKEFGGSLVWIQPLIENGAYEFESEELGIYNAHILNKIYISGNKNYYYIDWYSQSIIGTTKEDVKNWYKGWTFKNSQVWDLEYERPSFNIKWRY